MSRGDRGELNLGFDPGSMHSLNRLSAASTLPRTSGFPNGAYDNDGFANPYSFIQEQASTTNKGSPQLKSSEHNDGYEMPLELIQHYQETQRREARPKNVAKITRPKRLLDSWFNRVVLFLIMTFSVAAIFLVLMLMLGKVGAANCTACDNGALISSQAAQTFDQPEAVMDLSALVEMTLELEEHYNATLNHTQSHKGQLEEIKRTLETNLDELRDKLLQLNSTAHQNSPIFSVLSRLNSTFVVQVKNQESNRTKLDEDVQDNIIQVNSTLRDMLKAKLDEPGPRGPQGRNGSQGPQGPAEAPGDKGLEGHNGTQGQEGPPGDVGVNGPDGANGTQGEPGIKGLRGDKGNNGSVGNRGLNGTQGIQGVGNFSWCEHVTDIDKPSVIVLDTNDHKMFWVQCSTDLGHEYESKLEVASSGGVQEYTCKCKGSNGATPTCKLDYWKCPLVVP